jgi:hypothetical protein
MAGSTIAKKRQTTSLKKFITYVGTTQCGRDVLSNGMGRAQRHYL